MSFHLILGSNNSPVSTWNSGPHPLDPTRWGHGATWTARCIGCSLTVRHEGHTWQYVWPWWKRDRCFVCIICCNQSEKEKSPKVMIVSIQQLSWNQPRVEMLVFSSYLIGWQKVETLGHWTQQPFEAARKSSSQTTLLAAAVSSSMLEYASSIIKLDLQYFLEDMLDQEHMEQMGSSFSILSATRVVCGNFHVAWAMKVAKIGGHVSRLFI